MRNNYFKKTAFFLTACMVLFNAHSQARENKDSIDLFLESKIKQLKIPGLQLAVVQHGKVVKLCNYGLANIENGIEVSNKSLFSINSCTKSFVGIAVLQLQEEGKLNVNDPISKFLEDLPPNWQQLTIAQLFANSSGLPNIIDEYENILAGGDEQSAWQKVKTLPMESVPDSKFSYNQTGYVIIGKIINKVSGMHFTEFIKTRQFDPVGMKLTRFGDSYEIIPNSAGGYSTQKNINGKWSNAGELRNDYVKFPLFFRTATGIISNAEEIAKWIIALQSGKLLKQKNSLDILWNPHRLNNNQIAGFNKLVNGYALGWPTVTRKEHPALAPIGGMRSAYFIYPKDDLSIVVLSNLQGANPEWFIDEIAGYYIPGMHESDGFGLSSSMITLWRELRKKEYNNGISTVKALKKMNPDFQVEEDDLNALGYRLIGEHKQIEAQKIFKLYVDLYPKSGNAYDSYAEVLALNGNKIESIKNYKHSLTLNPQNTNAIHQLEILEKKQGNK
jgi:CubicO group peptidase (beta-lactamase class C family)